MTRSHERHTRERAGDPPPPTVGSGPGGPNRRQVGAVGALGGVLINTAFQQSFAAARRGDPAFWAFVAFYVVCIAVTWFVYLRPAPADVTHPRRAYARASVLTASDIAAKRGRPGPVTGGDHHGPRVDPVVAAGCVRRRGERETGSWSPRRKVAPRCGEGRV